MPGIRELGPTPKKSENLLRLSAVIIVIAAVSMAVSLPGAFDSGPIWPDGQRYTFNGILIHDMIRDGGLFQPYDYAVGFYARYPATNLPYGPFFYALNLAAAFSVFGVSFFVARCTTAFYTFLATLVCWYLFTDLRGNKWSGVIAAAAFLLNPMTAESARDILPNTAVLFYSFLSIYFFFKYIEEDQKFFGVLSALSFSLGYLCKPYITPLAFAMILYVLARRRWHALAKVETWIAVAISLFLVAPPTWLAYRFAQNELGPRNLPPIDLPLLFAYPFMAAKLLFVIFSFAVIGSIIGLIKRDKLTLLGLLWFVSACLFYVIRFRRYEFNYLYSFFPALLFPFVICCESILGAIRNRSFRSVFVTLLLGWFIYAASSTPVYSIRGFQEAGRYVAENPVGETVLYYGRYDGSFMMGYRTRVPKGGQYILRGDRHLAIRMSYGDMESRVVVRSVQEIISFLQEHKTGYVVLEKGMKSGSELPEYRLLLEAVKDKKLFIPVEHFQIFNNYSHSVGSLLTIYRFMFDEAAPSPEQLKITIPTMGKDLLVPLE